MGKAQSQADSVKNVLTNASERAKLKALLSEVTHCYRRIDDERESIKVIIDDASGTYGIKKSHLSRLAKIMYKHNYPDVRAEQDHFDTLCEVLLEGRQLIDSDDDDSARADG